MRSLLNLFSAKTLLPHMPDVSQPWILGVESGRPEILARPWQSRPGTHCLGFEGFSL